jgi:hypothetical protein
MKRSAFVHLANHCRATMALLPYSVALGMPDALAVAVFGQAMNILNHLPDLQPLNQEIDERFEAQVHEKKQPKTQEEKRRYWRGRQRVYRARRRLAEMEARERALAKLTSEELRALNLPD